VPGTDSIMAGEVPADVVDFVYRYIESVDVLECLLQLESDPARRWTLSQLAADLDLSEARASDILAGLCHKGLATYEGETYRYEPAEPELGRRVAQLVHAHRRRPSSVIAEILSLGPARSFADAFDLRTKKKKKNG
jgi:predicted transcriptional regulator